MIRYPGSKKKLVDAIINRFPDEMSLPLWIVTNGWEYREPFFGAGAIGFHVMELMPQNWTAWINDKDWGLVCLWMAVRDNLSGLMRRIEEFTPSVEAYEQFKDEDGDKHLDPLEVGFRKLALHQMSYGGFGVMSGGPLGGKKQSSNGYTIDCRWSVANLLHNVTECHRIFSRLGTLRISCGDYSTLIDNDPRTFLYLDPPYYEKGPELYKYSFSDEQHLDLAKRLYHTRNPWVLSYDDHPQIRKLYSWAHIEEIDVVYTSAPIRNKKRRKNREVIITPRA